MQVDDFRLPLVAALAALLALSSLWLAWAQVSFDAKGLAEVLGTSVESNEGGVIADEVLKGIDQIPESLREAARGLAPYDFVPVGLFLGAFPLLALALLLIGAWTDTRALTLVAIVAQVFGASLVAVGMIGTFVASLQLRRFFPDEWEPYAPSMSLAWGGFVYLLASGIFVVAAWAGAMQASESQRVPGRRPVARPEVSQRDRGDDLFD